MSKEQLINRLEEIKIEIRRLADEGNCKDIVNLIYEQTEVMSMLNKIQLAKMSTKRF